MNCWAVNRATSIAMLGLCHGQAATTKSPLRCVPAEEVEFVAAGLNHQT